MVEIVRAKVHNKTPKNSPGEGFFIFPAAINKIRRINFGLGNGPALGDIEGVQQPLNGVTFLWVGQPLETGGSTLSVHQILVVIFILFVFFVPAVVWR